MVPPKTSVNGRALSVRPLRARPGRGRDGIIIDDPPKPEDAVNAEGPAPASITDTTTRFVPASMPQNSVRSKDENGSPRNRKIHRRLQS
jgi:hypothetical protein